MGGTAISSNNQTTSINQPILKCRLLDLKNKKFLTNRFFMRISENIHYEIFKYLNGSDLLEVRITKLGGYQLSSNSLLRSRIKNFYIRDPDLTFLQLVTDVNNYTRKIEAMYDQMGDQELNLRKTYITDLHCAKLIEIFKDFPTLRGINLSDNRITLDLAVSNEMWKFMFNMLSVDLSRNNIGETGGVNIAENLKYLPNLQALILDENRIKEAGGFKLAFNLKYIPNLQILSLWGNKIEAIGCIKLAENLKYVSKLKALTLGSNNIGESGGKKLFENLKYIPNLQILSLYGNNIGEWGSSILAYNLKYVPCLQELLLNNNNIGEVGGINLVENIKYLHNLEELFLYHNKMGDAAGRKIIENLEYLPRLKKLYLSGNRIEKSKNMLIKITSERGIKMICT